MSDIPCSLSQHTTQRKKKEKKEKGRNNRVGGWGGGSLEGCYQRARKQGVQGKREVVSEIQHEGKGGLQVHIHQNQGPPQSSGTWEISGRAEIKWTGVQLSTITRESHEGARQSNDTREHGAPQRMGKWGNMGSPVMSTVTTSALCHSSHCPVGDSHAKSNSNPPRGSRHWHR